MAAMLPESLICESRLRLLARTTLVDVAPCGNATTAPSAVAAPQDVASGPLPLAVLPQNWVVALSLMASIRAVFSASTIALAEVVKRLDRMRLRKLGTAIMARMAAIASVTINSTSVNPQARQRARRRAMKWLRMVLVFPGTTVLPLLKPTMRDGSSSPA